MSKKDNFRKAANDLFGIGGTGPDDAEQKEAVAEEAAEASAVIQEDLTAVWQAGPEPVAPVKAAPVIPEPPAAPKYQTTILAEGSTFEGTLQTKGDVDLACEFRGDILSEGKVTMRTSLVGNVVGNCVELVDCRVQGDIQAVTLVKISTRSVVTGDIKTQDLLCSGEIAGNIEAKGHVTLSSGDKLKGDLTAATLSIERGAVIEGNLKVSQSKK